MSSDRVYHMDDCVLSLPEGFVDRSINVLEWPLPSGDTVVLVVQRERLSKDLGFDGYIAQETKSYPSQFEAFHDEGEERASLEYDVAVHHLKFRWKRDRDVLYNHQAFVDAGEAVIVLTVTGKASHKGEADSVIERSLEKLKFREG